ncbi:MULTISPECIES: DUF3575 domain-containing protein [Sphingobacterium]|uniref:DUF3575 domain-containing protein n=1 Tax=Sphingobacterium populi TaxID=1812824 RepID=A0ABW5UCB6_9SPHI|nr:DUF3575 domain-containing protein [Sphingobacterium sp. CFCC 11742]
MNLFLFKDDVLRWILLFSALIPSFGIAQEQDDFDAQNLIKLNALPLAFGKFAVEYEHSVVNRISVGVEVGFFPKSRLPFRSIIARRPSDSAVQDLIRNFQNSGFSVAPEVRFYISSRERLTGWYVAPYFRYATYNAMTPYAFEVSQEFMGQVVYERSDVIPISGRVDSFVGGVSIGANFKLADQWFLDCRIIGPGYGSAKGDFVGNIQLEEFEQQVLRERLADLRQDLHDFTIPIHIASEVSSDGLTINVQRSPWATLRAGLSIAYRF